MQLKNEYYIIIKDCAKDVKDLRWRRRIRTGNEPLHRSNRKPHKINIIIIFVRKISDEVWEHEKNVHLKLQVNERIMQSFTSSSH